MKNIRRWLKIVLTVNGLLLLPCAAITVFKLFGWDTNLLYYNWTFFGAMLPVVLLTCFYIPYIAAGIGIPGIAALLIRDAIKGQSRRREVCFCAAISFINILGILSLWEVFLSAMSV